MSSYDEMQHDLFDPDQQDKNGAVEEQRRPAYEDPSRGVAVTGRDYVYESKTVTLTDGETDSMDLTLKGGEEVRASVAGSGDVSLEISYYASDARNQIVGAQEVIKNATGPFSIPASLEAPTPYARVTITHNLTDGTDYTYTYSATMS